MLSITVVVFKKKWSSDTIRNCCLHLSDFPSTPYKRPTTEIKRIERRVMGTVSPANKEVWGCRKLSQRGLGRILCNFAHLLAHLTAAWKWDIPTSLVASIGLIFPFNFLGVSDTQLGQPHSPTWIVGVSKHPRHPQRLVQTDIHQRTDRNPDQLLQDPGYNHWTEPEFLTDSPDSGTSTVNNGTQLTPHVHPALYH